MHFRLHLYNTGVVVGAGPASMNLGWLVQLTFQCSEDAAFDDACIDSICFS